MNQLKGRILFKKIMLYCFTFLIGCAEPPIQQSEKENQLSIQTILKNPHSSALFASNSLSGAINSVRSDTSSIKQIVSFQDSIVSDSSEIIDEKLIAEILETSRKHYLAALQAQAEGDSATSASEFEQAIQHLSELSDYQDIESNADFNELSRSIVEDYEKYIATIDSLGPNSSIFALREKLNFEIEKVDITNIHIPQSLLPKTDVALDINDYSKRTLAFFMGKGRHHMETWIYRSGKYFPMMKRIFKEEGVPEEVVYLSMAESGLNPTARSWAKAVGLWQFMKATGAMYGLRSTFWYDERRDFEKSTRAAARHLKDLFIDYNNWHLVLVAYNAGPGWVNRGIRRSGSTDYWEMRSKLPRETRNYVPQFIAVTLMVMRPEAFGLDSVETADSLSYEKVTVDDCIDLSLLADAAGTTLDTLRDLNPELTQWCTPPNYKGYQLRVPVGRTQLFAENYAKIPDNKKMDFATHTVRRGETISTIGKKYGILSSVLQDVNRLPRKKKLKVGTTLIIPVQSTSVAGIIEAQRKKQFEEEQKAKERREKILAERKTKKSTPKTIAAESSKRNRAESTYEPSGRVKIIYNVKQGETIGHIAEWFNVRASHIRNWNNISYGRFIHAGQRLNIFVPEEKMDQYKKIAALTFDEKQKAVKSAPQKIVSSKSFKHGNNWIQHTVKKGETLEKIAGEHDVAIADLKSWNKLHKNKIKIGQVLEVFSSDGVDANDETIKENSNKQQKQSSIKLKAKEELITHVVKKGETLEKIAEKYNVTITDVKKWNNLSASKITVGQKLRIFKTDHV